MAKPLSSVYEAVRGRGKGLVNYTRRIDALVTSRHITRTDAERAYAGAFLLYYAFVERSIERAFMGLLRGRLIAGTPGVRPLVTVNSDRVARDIVNSDRSYVNWLPYDRYTRKRARAFFSTGRPFSNLPKPERDKLARIAILRNALAHESAASLRVFEREFTAGKALRPNERRPAGYLRGIHSVGQTRFEHLVAEATDAIRALCV